jgi:hypothetical protein
MKRSNRVGNELGLGKSRSEAERDERREREPRRERQEVERRQRRDDARRGDKTGQGETGETRRRVTRQRECEARLESTKAGIVR